MYMYLSTCHLHNKWTACGYIDRKGWIMAESTEKHNYMLHLCTLSYVYVAVLVILLPSSLIMVYTAGSGTFALMALKNSEYVDESSVSVIAQAIGCP